MNDDLTARADEAVRTEACDHDAGICWGKPLPTTDVEPVEGLHGKPLGAMVDPQEPQEKRYTSEEIRRATRADDRARAKRKKKGNRVFQRTARQEQYRRDTIAAQVRVLQTREPGDPMYDNVYNSLVRKYGPEIDAMIEAEKSGVVA